LTIQPGGNTLSDIYTIPRYYLFFIKNITPKTTAPIIKYVFELVELVGAVIIPATGGLLEAGAIGIINTVETGCIEDIIIQFE